MKAILFLFLILFSLNGYAETEHPCWTPDCLTFQAIREAERAASEAFQKSRETRQKAEEFYQKLGFFNRRTREEVRAASEVESVAREAFQKSKEATQRARDKELRQSQGSN